MRAVNSVVKHAVAAAGAGLLLASVIASPASAASFDNGLASTAPATILVSEDIGLHTKYPGSDSDAAKAARAKRNSLHYICDKSPERCQ